MGFRQGMQACQKRLQFAGFSLTQGLRRNGLNRRKGVLDTVSALLQKQLLSFLSALALVLRAHALNTEPELAGDSYGNIHVGFAESVGCRVVRHKLADELAFHGQRNESESRYAFSPDRGFEGSIELGRFDVADANRFQLCGFTGPGR